MAIQKVNTTSDLTTLRTMVKQLREAKDVDNASRTLSKRFKDNALYLQGWLPYIAAGPAHIDAGQMELAVKVLDQIGDAFSPMAEIMWTQDDLATTVAHVQALRTLGMYSDDELAEANALLDELPSLNKSRNSSGTRGEAPTIEGRPATILVYRGTDPANANRSDYKITSQAGNKATSPGNIKLAIVKWLERQKDASGNYLTVTEAQKDGIGEALRPLIHGDVTSVQIGDFATAVAVASTASAL